MCTVAPGMGSGWEANIARLINQANEALSSSAHSRLQHTSPYRGSRTPSPLRHPTPATFRSDRSASYRRDLTGWDASLLSRAGGGRYSDGCVGPGSSPTKVRPTAAPATFSRLTEARVNDARIDGMEDKIRLEVQTVVRRDVDQRLSVAQRATEALLERVSDLAEDVSGIGETVRKFNMGAQSQTDALGQIQSDCNRSRNALSLFETWRVDREGWCARTDDSLSSLAEEARVLARRGHSQQRALDESATQEGLAHAIKTTQKAGEAATASAIAPVREHFLEELGMIRRRLLTVEDEAKILVTPEVTPTQVVLAADKAAAAKGNELWQRMEVHVREKIAEEAKETAAATNDVRKGFERRLTEVDGRVGTCGSALDALQAGEATSGEVSSLRDVVAALQQQLMECLARTKESHEGGSREGRLAAEEQATLATPVGLAVTRDLDDRLKRLEESERSRSQSAVLAHPIPSPAPPSVPVERVDTISETMKELVSGAAAATRRQSSSEDRLEVLSEKLCGHSLKLRCLEGLWRENGSMDCNEGTGTRVDAGDSKGNNSRSRSSRSSSSSSSNDAIGMAGDGQTPASASATPFVSSRLSGFLKRLGSKASSSSHEAVPLIGSPETTPGPGGGGGAVVEAQSEKSPAPVVETRGAEEGDDRSSEDGVSDESGGREQDATGADAATVHRTESDGSSTSSTSDSIDKDGPSALSPGEKGTKNTPRGNEATTATSSISGVGIDRGGERLETENEKEKGALSQPTNVPQTGKTGDSVTSSSEKTTVDGRPPRSGSSLSVENSATKTPTASKTAGGQEKELQNDDIGDDSVHSSWGLPGAAGTTGGLLGEQRAVWGGGGREEDSVGSVEQAPSDTESGERGSDDKSPRSRVESYDLQVDDDYMVPFSPDREEVPSPSPATGTSSRRARATAVNERSNSLRSFDSSQEAPADPDTDNNKEPAVSHGASVNTAHEAAAEDGKTLAGVAPPPTTATPPAAATPPTLTAASATSEEASDGGNGDMHGSGSVKEFCFSDDDDDDEEGSSVMDGRGATRKGDGNSMDVDAGRVGVGGGEVGGNGTSDNDDERTQQRGNRRKSSDTNNNDDDDDDADADADDHKESTTEKHGRHAEFSSPLGSSQSGQDDAVGKSDDSNPPASSREREGKGGVVSACPTLAPGTWAPPDFGFSSEDDGGDSDLDLDLSISDSSGSRPPEGTGEDGGAPLPSSSSLARGGSDSGFDTSSVAS